MILLILAAGKSARFDGFPKQNLVVNGETLLDRQMRLFGPPISKAWLVTHRPDEVKHAGATAFIPNARRWKCETLFCTRTLWRPNEPLLVLHGDVYFTEQAAETILSLWTNGPTFFWDTHEVFSLLVPGPCQDELLKALCHTLDHMDRFRAQDNDCGLGCLLNKMQELKMPYATVEIADDTQDFDTPDEHAAWASGWRKNKLLAVAN